MSTQGPNPPGTPVERDAETIALFSDFFEETNEGLDQVERLMLEMERAKPGSEATHALFRVFHTIKGVASFLELHQVASLAHATEAVLNLMRDGSLIPERRHLDLLFESASAMRRNLTRLRAEVEAGQAFSEDALLPPLIERLGASLPGAAPAAPAPAAPQTEEAAAVIPLPADAAAPSAPPAEPVKAEPALPWPPVTSAVPPAAATDATEAAAPATHTSTQETGEAGRRPAARLRETLKVDIERVDSLVEMIGELIIVESMVLNAPEIAALPSLKVRHHLAQLTKISRDLQAVAMRMRMVPVEGVFLKSSRMVRELSRKLGKEAVLLTEGESTEMDRSMVERIEDPLVHMLRNALDHGIETTTERSAAGKPPVATLKLSAYHEGGSVVVELSDDGRGLQREAILAKARRQGLIRDGQELSDSEVFALIFLPSFSTAAKVTEVSGRGVGLDVVKKNVEAMRGRVQVRSVPGQGTTFRLVLPLTLAIIDGMLISCGGERYIIPSLSIIESLQPTPGMVRTLAGSGELLNVRGEILPLLRLHHLLGTEGAQRDPCQAHAVVVESLGRKLALLVDDVITQQQVVIKPLGPGVDAEYLSGAAILSDGRVGLILNVDHLGQLSRARPVPSPSSEVAA